MARTLLYHKGTDHLAGTYLTNYLQTVSWLIGACVIFYFRKPSCALNILLSISQSTILCLISMAVGMLFAGLVHQFLPYDYRHPEAPILFHIIWRVVLFCVSTASINIIFISYGIYHYNPTAAAIDTALPLEADSHTKHRCVIIACVVVLVVMNVVYIILPSLIIVAALHIISCTILISICAIKLCKDKNISKCALSLFITSAAIQIFGNIFQWLLRSCGQVVIPPECPLTEACNHNCFYHIITCVGLCFLIPSVLVLIPAEERS